MSQTCVKSYPAFCVGPTIEKTNSERPFLLLVFVSMKKETHKCNYNLVTLEQQLATSPPPPSTSLDNVRVVLVGAINVTISLFSAETLHKLPCQEQERYIVLSMLISYQVSNLLLVSV